MSRELYQYLMQYYQRVVQECFDTRDHFLVYKCLNKPTTKVIHMKLVLVQSDFKTIKLTATLIKSIPPNDVFPGDR